LPAQTHRQRNARGQGARLREEIVDAATRLLEQAGRQDAVTLRAVAREAGVSATSIYAHFGTVPEILDAVVGRTFESFSAMLLAAGRDATSARERLMARNEACLAFAREQPERYRLLFGRDPDGAVPGRSRERSGEAVAQRERAFRVLIDGIRDAQVEAGAPGDEAAADATLFWAALHGYALLQRDASGLPWPGPDREVVGRMLDRLCRLS
jgi:AcrR family transcriptional regulator